MSASSDRESSVRELNVRESSMNHLPKMIIYQTMQQELKGCLITDKGLKAIAQAWILWLRLFTEINETSNVFGK